MHPNELSELSDFQLLDLRLPDDYEAVHLAAALNNCVFEVSFIDQLEKTAPNPSLTTLVYGANDDSMEAAVAVEKMQQAGYTDVQILAGGFQAARQAGLPIVTGKPLPDTAQLTDGRHAINLEESSLEWLGRNLLNKHWGTAPIESGHLEFCDGKLTSGEFVIDLQQMACSDLKNSDLHDILIDHLHSDDFFDVKNHPKATFTLKNSSPLNNSSPGACNLAITGELTLRGQTHPIEFEAAVGLTPEGQPAAQASFSIDRTQWGILYGSGKFFHRLAGHLVNDLLEFQIKILTH
ncbi:MAG: YceI family protein [Verrucomicrobiota bacterium]